MHATLNKVPKEEGTPSQAVKSGYVANKMTESLWRNRKKIATYYMGDTLGLVWRVKVRRTTKRGRYVRVEPVGLKGPCIRASVDAYQPERYLPVDPATWEALAFHSPDSNDWRVFVDVQEQASAARVALTRLVRDAHALYRSQTKEQLS